MRKNRPKRTLLADRCLKRSTVCQRCLRESEAKEELVCVEGGGFMVASCSACKWHGPFERR